MRLALRRVICESAAYSVVVAVELWIDAPRRKDLAGARALPAVALMLDNAYH